MSLYSRRATFEGQTQLPSAYQHHIDNLGERLVGVLQHYKRILPKLREFSYLDWERSFDSNSVTHYAPDGEFFLGFYKGGGDRWYNIEAAITAKGPYVQTARQAIDWRGGLNNNHQSVHCQDNMSLVGIYKSGYEPSRLDYGTCASIDEPVVSQDCYWTNSWPGDHTWILCDPGYYISGFNRGGCNNQWCLTFECCAFELAPLQITLH